MIPQKKSSKWIGVFIFYTIIIFISLFTTRVMLSSEMLSRYILGLLIISVSSALIPCIGGFFGKRIFFIIYTLSVIVSILYMFYIVLGNTAPGWGDLTSIISYIYIVTVGAFLALVMEIVSYFVKIKLNKKM